MQDYTLFLNKRNRIAMSSSIFFGALQLPFFMILLWNDTVFSPQELVVIAISGIVFSLLMYLAYPSLYRSFYSKFGAEAPVLAEGEHLEAKITAHMGMASGIAYLTNKNIFFKSHKFSLSKAALALKYTAITDVQVSGSLGNKVKLITSGQKLSFYVAPEYVEAFIQSIRDKK